MAAAVQPWLVDQGEICPVLNPAQDPRNRRTFILTDGAGRWAIGVCDGIGLHELARVLLHAAASSSS